MYDKNFIKVLKGEMGVNYFKFLIYEVVQYHLKANCDKLKMHYRIIRRGAKMVA